MAEKWYQMPNGKVRHPSGVVREIDKIQDQIDDGRIELIPYEGSDLQQEVLAGFLVSEKEVLAEQTKEYWKTQKEKDFTFNGDTFPFYEGIETNILGKLQMGGFYESLNGAGTFITEWTKKDYTQAVFNLEQIWLFGMKIAEQIENAKKQEAKHLANIQKLSDYATLKGYNFREIIN